MKLVARFFQLLFFVAFSATAQRPIVTIQSITANSNNTIAIEYTLANATANTEVSLFWSTDTFKTNADVSALCSGDINLISTPGVKSISLSTSNLNANDLHLSQLRIVAIDESSDPIPAIVAAINGDSIWSYLDMLEGRRHYTSAPTHLNEVRDFIASRFSASGFEPVVQPFAYGGDNAENSWVTLPGFASTTHTIISDAHYDAVNVSPGADDNASGVAGMLEILRVINSYPSESNMRFIAFDLEESGLVGSGRYVFNGGIEPNDTIDAVFNFEMIGYVDSSNNSQTVPNGFNLLFPQLYAQLQADTFKGDFILLANNTSSAQLAAAFSNANSTYVPALKTRIAEVAGTGTQVADLRRSDHARFWDASLPAIMITDGANFRNNHYHTSTDSVYFLDKPFTTLVTQTTAAAIASMAGVKNGSFDVAVVDMSTAIAEEESNCTLQSRIQNGVISVQALCFLQNATIRLVDIAGREVFSENNVTVNGQYDRSINHLLPGTYVLQILSAQKVYSSKLFVH